MKRGNIQTQRLKYPAVILTLALISMLSSCLGTAKTVTVDSSPAAVDTIIVYGREGCYNCKTLRVSLDAKNAVYTFLDVDLFPEYNKEMWNKIRSVSESTDSIQLPVVDVNGTILINHPTDFKQLRSYLNH